MMTAFNFLVEIQHVKLSALKGGASRQDTIIYIVPLDPGVKTGACGAHAGQQKRHLHFPRAAAP